MLWFKPSIFCVRRACLRLFFCFFLPLYIFRRRVPQLSVKSSYLFSVGPNYSDVLIAIKFLREAAHAAINLTNACAYLMTNVCKSLRFKLNMFQQIKNHQSQHNKKRSPLAHTYMQCAYRPWIIRITISEFSITDKRLMCIKRKPFEIVWFAINLYFRMVNVCAQEQPYKCRKTCAFGVSVMFWLEYVSRVVIYHTFFSFGSEIDASIRPK